MACKLGSKVVGSNRPLRARRLRLVALVLSQIPAVAYAQAPAAPAAPAAPSVALPAAPTLPAAPAAPPVAAPAAPPAAAPAASAPPPLAPPATGAPTPAAPVVSEGKPAVAPQPGDTRDANIVLFDKPSKAQDDNVPPTLPRALARTAAGSNLQVQDRKGGALTIEEIVNAPIVSASNRRESSLAAPAMVLVITAKDIRDRGYTDLSQILDDLPGMDVVRPYGDVYVKSYWRGYRPGAGADPYLIMMDGVLLNSLFYKDAQILAAFPLSNVDHVEILYGPASAVYGPNAAMGIINVITADGHEKQVNNEYGASLESRITYGGPQRNMARFADASKIVDGSLLYATKDFRLRLTTRLENSVLDTSIGNNFEYTKPQYYSEPRIWGAQVLAANPNLMGKFYSPDQKRAFDLRMYLGENTELTAQYFAMSTGLGTRYAADRVQTQTPWNTSELSVYGRHTGKLSPSATSTSLVQFRQSNVTNSPSFGRSATGSKFDDVGPNLIAVQAPNSSIVLQQDFDVEAARSMFLDGDKVALDLGVRYQHLELSNGYQFLTNVTYPLASADPIKNARNDLGPVQSSQYAADEIGAYVLGTYTFPAANAINLGVRVDHSTVTDNLDATVRGGYVGTFDKLTLKLLYGQAVYDPSPYDLAGATTPLQPERSQTIEGNVTFTLPMLALTADGYYVDYSHPIVDGKNLDARHIAGADIGARLILRPVQIWAYYSRYLVAEESSSTGGIGPIGDLAFNKIWAGATFEKGPVTATLLGRFIGARDTVDTNPEGHVPAYFVLDANVMVRHVFYDGLWTGLRVSNLLDAKYSQPGMQTAGSGSAPGVFNGTGYLGSRDINNSLLPQPRRALFLTLGLDI